MTPRHDNMKTKFDKHVPWINSKHLMMRYKKACPRNQSCSACSTFSIWHHDMTAWQPITFETTHENKTNIDIWQHDNRPTWHHNIWTFPGSQLLTCFRGKQLTVSLVGGSLLVIFTFSLATKIESLILVILKFSLEEIIV